MTQTGPFQSFAGHKYLSLETFRKTGEGVKTPVWFAESGLDTPAPVLYVYTVANFGKAKRIRNNSRVRVALCDMRGNVLGDWEDARAEIVHGETAVEGMRGLNRKYAPWKQILNFFSAFRKREQIVIAIRPA